MIIELKDKVIMIYERLFPLELEPDLLYVNLFSHKLLFQILLHPKFSYFFWPGEKKSYFYFLIAYDASIMPRSPEAFAI